MSARLTRLRTGDYRVTPWKNGGGTTTEIAVHPPAGGLAGGFAWRVSVADVATSGPFSAFPGYDRVIVPLAGGPLELDHGPHGRQRLTALVPYRFPGDWATTGMLTAGAAKDFNVMTRRGAFMAHVESLALTASLEQCSRRSTDTMLVYVTEGKVEVRLAPGADADAGPGAGVPPSSHSSLSALVEAGECAVVHDGDGMSLRLAGRGSCLLVRLPARRGLSDPPA